MHASNPAKTPLPVTFCLLPATDDEFETARHLPFPQAVGAILYASTISWPDLAHLASVLSRALSKWNKEHWLAVKHILHYIRGTSDLCLTFNATSGKHLTLRYADADWGGGGYGHQVIDHWICVQGLWGSCGMEEQTAVNCGAINDGG